MLHKKAIAATTGPEGSYLNLLNPISQFFGNKIDRYPKFMLSLFGGDTKTAWLASKLGASGLLAAAATALARGVRHANQMSALSEVDNPAKNIRTDISTTFKGKLMPTPPKEKSKSRKERRKEKKEQKAAENIEKSAAEGIVESADPFDIPENTLRIGLPVGATILASALSYKLVDKLADTARNKALTKTIDNKRNAVRQLLMTRARVGRGTATPEEVEAAVDKANASENYIKTAGLDKRALWGWFDKFFKGSLNSAGLLAAGLLGASAIGSYKYFSMNDPNNIKYKAMKKGLKEYATQKSMITPITNVPEDAQEYFAAIDKGEKEKSTRELPEQQSTHRQLSVSID